MKVNKKRLILIVLLIISIGALVLITAIIDNKRVPEIPERNEDVILIASSNKLLGGL